MIPKVSKEIAVAILLILILCVCYYHILPEGMAMMTYSALIILFGIVAALTWHDKPADEREAAHKMISAQAAYTAGGVILVLSIIYQGLTEQHVHPSIYYAFGAMILAKIVGRLWAQKYR